MTLVRSAVAGMATLMVGIAGVACTELPTEPNTANLQAGLPTSWGLVGGVSAAYVVGTDRNTFHGGKQSLAIVGTDTSRLRFSGVGQLLRAEDYLGKRVRLRAWTLSSKIQGGLAGLWMRIDGPGATLGFDNFSSRPLLGSSTWRQVEIILDVPANAIGIHFGALMSGRGELFVDEMSFDVIPATGPTTNQLTEPTPVAIDSATMASSYSRVSRIPLNLDFESR